MKHQIVLALALFSFITSCKTKGLYSNVWIDKNENENYTARHECSFVQAGEKFIMFGGRESAKKLDKYDFKTDTWSSNSNFAPKEFNHFQATFYKGFVWVIGSFKTNSFPREIPEENVWLYSPSLDTWIKGPEIPENRRRGGAGLVVYKDVFYLIGGNTIGHDGGYVNWFDSYNPKTNTWTILPNASQERDHFHAGVIGNKLYAAGGRKSGGEGGVFAPLVGVVDTYNFDTKKWSVLKDDLPTPRAAPGIATFNGELFVMGGEGEHTGPAYKLVEAYNPLTQSWSRKADMHYPRHGTQTIVSGNGIYIAAGSPKRGGGEQLNMEVYNEDKPEGSVLTASYLEAPEEVVVKSGNKAIVKIKNTGGNSASFINSLVVSKTASSKFKINSDYNLKLVDDNSTFEIEVAHIGGSVKDMGDIVVSYNGNLTKRIQLVCE